MCETPRNLHTVRRTLGTTVDLVSGDNGTPVTSIGAETCSEATSMSAPPSRRYASLHLRVPTSDSAAVIPLSCNDHLTLRGIVGGSWDK